MDTIGLNKLDNELAQEIRVLRNKIDMGIASEKQYQRYHELINLGGINDEYIQSKLKPYNIEKIEEYREKKDTIKDEHKALGVILGLGLAALFLWTLTEKDKK